MVDVEVAARTLSKAIFPLEHDRTAGRRGTIAVRGFLRLCFADRAELLKGQPLTRRLQSMAAGESPTIDNIEIWRRIIASTLKPGTAFGLVAFGTGRSLSFLALSHVDVDTSAKPNQVERDQIRELHEEGEEGIEMGSALKGRGGETKVEIGQEGESSLGARTHNDSSVPSAGAPAAASASELHRDFGRAVRTASGGSVSKLGIGVARAGSPHVVGMRPGRPHVLVKLGSVEHTERLFAAGEIQVRGKTYRVTRPHSSDAQDIGSPARSTRGGADQMTASSSTEPTKGSSVVQTAQWMAETSRHRNIDLEISV